MLSLSLYSPSTTYSNYYDQHCTFFVAGRQGLCIAQLILHLLARAYSNRPFLQAFWITEAPQSLFFLFSNSSSSLLNQPINQSNEQSSGSLLFSSPHRRHFNITSLSQFSYQQSSIISNNVDINSTLLHPLHELQVQDRPSPRLMGQLQAAASPCLQGKGWQVQGHFLLQGHHAQAGVSLLVLRMSLPIAAHYPP